MPHGVLLAVSRGVAVLLLLLLVLGGSAAAQQDEMAVMIVRNRAAQDLVDALSPLVGPSGSVTAMNDRLIVRAPSHIMATLRKMVAELDVAPRSLLITVRRQGSSSDSRESAQAGGVVKTGGVTVMATGSGAGGVATTESRTTRVVVGGSLGASSVDGSSGAVQRVQALDGQRAFIGTGVEMPPVATGGTWPATIAGQSAVSGFHALPRLAGDVVTVEIWVSDDRMTPSGLVRAERLGTTLSGRLGEWLRLGSSEASSSTTSRGPLARESHSSVEMSSLELRVELLR
jgi:hypothetical protein